MTFVHGSKSRVYIKGIHASGYVKSLGADSTIDKAETTNLLSAGKEYIPGQFDGTVSLDGYFDGNGALDTATFSYALEALKGVTTQTTYLPQGDTFGAGGYGIQGFYTKDSIKTNTSDAGSIALEVQSSVGLERGLVEHVLGAETTSGTGTSIDNGALLSPSTNGAAAYLQVTALSGTGTPSVTAIIEHSTTGAVWATLLSFTLQSTVGSQRVAVTGTVNRYTRCSWTIAGTGPSVTFSVLFARK